VILTNVLPAGVSFVSAVSDQGGCFETNGIVICDLGVVPGGTNVSVVVVVNSPDSATVLSYRASVTRNEVDPYLSNNVALAQTRVNNRPSISISDAIIMEGDSGTTGAILMAKLSVRSSETVTVDYATADGTAEQGTDYIAASGTISFLPGTTNQPVTVQIVGDTNDESEETLFVNLSNPVNATLGESQGICRIIDDDGPSISISKINAAEGQAGTNNVVFTVKLSAASPQTVTVEYATEDDSAIAGSDYLEASGTLTFPPGVTNLNVTIRVKGDIAIEPDESFFVNLFNPTNASVLVSPGIGTILNDDGLPGELEHFEWSPISSPQRVNQPFTTVLFGRDALNQPGLNFTGTAELEAATGNPDSTIGTGTATWSAPLDSSYGISRVQVIYLAKEVGSARRVTALALNVTGIPPRTLSRWTIRMRHTTLNSYGSRPVWERTGWTTVYQQDQPVRATGWTTFTFTRPFDFNGANNLMVDFSFKNDDSDFNGGECVSSDIPDARSLSYGTFGFNGSADDPLTWSGTLPQPGVNLQIPDIRLSTITLVRITPTNSGAFVDGSWIGTFTVDTSVTNLAIRATDPLGHTGESARFAVGQQVSVFRGLFTRIGRLGGDAETSQPLHAHVAFKSRQQQPQRIALLRTQPLTILAVYQHRVFEAFFDGNASCQSCCIGAFGDDPFCAGLQSRFLQHEFQADPGPFGAAQETNEIRSRLAVGLFVAWVTRAFEEIDVRLRRKAPDVVHGKDKRLVDQAVEHQPVLRRVDRGDAGVMAFVEQSVRRDDAV
jgi:hypothetical protein